MGRPEWRPERGITGSAVEAQAQVMISHRLRARTGTEKMISQDSSQLIKEDAAPDGRIGDVGAGVQPLRSDRGVTRRSGRIRQP
jgi:hypothetical protein